MREVRRRSPQASSSMCPFHPAEGSKASVSARLSEKRRRHLSEFERRSISADAARDG
jgi:hypothetical protein